LTQSSWAVADSGSLKHCIACDGRASRFDWIRVGHPALDSVGCFPSRYFIPYFVHKLCKNKLLLVLL